MKIGRWNLKGLDDDVKVVYDRLIFTAKVNGYNPEIKRREQHSSEWIEIKITGILKNYKLEFAHEQGIFHSLNVLSLGSSISKEDKALFAESFNNLSVLDKLNLVIASIES